jgi:hypothetical protein
MRVAANDLSRESPLLPAARTLLNVDGYADRENQTAEQLTKTASTTTRRQPVLVFGLAPPPSLPFDLQCPIHLVAADPAKRSTPPGKQDHA